MTSKLHYEEDLTDSDSFEKNNDDIKFQKRRRRNRVWIKIAEFDSAEEAEKQVMTENVWRKTSAATTLDGNKVIYRCSAGKYRTEECPAALYLLYHSTNSKVSMFSTECAHDNHRTEPTRGLDNETKCFVRSIFEEGVQKPNAILALIRRKNMKEPSKAKLIPYLNQLRRDKYGSLKISGREISKWCKLRENIPTSKDIPFVLKHFICCEPFDTEKQDLKIVISTLRLLENLEKSDMVQTDVTHKMIWQGYPVMIVGTSDKDNVFHPFALAICKGENADDFSFIFEALHKYNSNWKPLFLLADSSEAITQGFTKIFGIPQGRRICFSCVFKNLEKNFKKLNKCEDLKQDIYALRTCKDKDTFLTASKLFLEKWMANNDHEIKTFIEYFNLEWLQKNSNWYEGVAVGYPSTNDGLAATNADIKKEHILRERLPVGQFLNNVIKLLNKWSKDMDPELPNFKKFSEVPSISSRQWEDAYQWAMLNNKIIQENKVDSIHCYICSSELAAESITLELMISLKETDGKWTSFDEFKKYNCSVLTIKIDFKNLDKSSCTCPYFSKHLHCKHILGMKIRLKLVTVPSEIKLIPIEQKRKRGRPSIAKRTLII